MAESTAKLIEGADLDVVLQEPLKKTMEMMEKAQESRSKLQAFRKDSTLLVEEIKNFKDHLDQPREEIAKLIQEKEGDKLVGKSLKEVRKVLETMSKENSEHGITCLPPQNPEFIIGIEEEPLLRLKMEVLKDGASTLELTGQPRSGKAALVGKFGSDDQVKDHQQKMIKKKKKKVVMVPPKRGSIKRPIFLAIFNFMADMVSYICCSDD